MGIKKALEQAKLKDVLVSVYVDSDDWGQYSVGHIDLITETHVRIRSVSKYGEDAGYEVRLLSEVFKIEHSGKYENKIKKLIKHKGSIFKEVKPRCDSSGNIIRDSLQQSLDESIGIVVWGKDPDDSLAGYVKSMDSGLVNIQVIDEFGEDDGVSLIDIEEITSLDFNTHSEQVRQFLFKSN